MFVVTGAGAVSIDVAGMRGGLLVGPANCRCSCNPRCGCEGHAKRDARVLAARCANIAGVRRTSTTADDSTNRRREIERGMARPRLDGGAEERGSSCAVPASLRGAKASAKALRRTNRAARAEREASPREHHGC